MVQTKILSKFYTDPPAGVGDELPNCDQPKAEFLDDGTPVMKNETWFKLYLSCVNAVKQRDAELKLWENWVENELKEQELNNAN